MNTDTSPAISRDVLEELYATYNRRELVHPDPLEFLYGYEDVRDREIVALVASFLACGRVTQILKSVKRVLEQMPAPAMFLERSSPDTIRSAFAGFKHRFTTGEALAALLACPPAGRRVGAKRVSHLYGSLGAAFKAGLSDEHETVLPALAAFAHEFAGETGARQTSPLPSPADGSACKRLNLFLRWMVRHDAVDPGGWDHVPASKLIVPLDTHMLRISRALRFTQREQADIRTAREVTAAFRQFIPEDPVRYDFALTRLGIRHDTDPSASSGQALDAFLRRCLTSEAT